MLRGLVRWVVRAGAIAALVAVAVRLAGSRRQDGEATGPLFPAIGGDTWPPVPARPRPD